MAELVPESIPRVGRRRFSSPERIRRIRESKRRWAQKARNEDKSKGVNRFSTPERLARRRELRLIKKAIWISRGGVLGNRGRRRVEPPTLTPEATQNP